MMSEFDNWFLSGKERKSIHTTKYDARIIWNAAIGSIKKENAILPKELTAENGAKALLIGEFHETVNIPNPDYCGDQCGDCDLNCEDDDPCKILESSPQKVPVSWTTIKAIYKKIVNHYQEF